MFGFKKRKKKTPARLEVLDEFSFEGVGAQNLSSNCSRVSGTWYWFVPRRQRWRYMYVAVRRSLTTAPAKV